MYLTHGSAALRLAFLLTGNRALAEDIAQDAFARMAGRLAHLRDPAAFGAYLRQTVVNLVRMHWRRERLERALLRRHHEPSMPNLALTSISTAICGGACRRFLPGSVRRSFCTTTKTCLSSRPQTSSDAGRARIARWSLRA